MKTFKSTLTALITPFENNKVHVPSLERLVKQQLDAGIDGFVVNGTTAESPNLSKEEVKTIFEVVKGISGNAAELVLGVGSNSTDKTVANAKLGVELKADGLLVVVPYYNKPPQRGLEEHFRTVADATDLPLLLYNVPGRTITSLEPETIFSLSKHKNIVGIKEASGKIDLASKIAEMCGSNFTLLSGDDGTYVEFLNVGGHGVISVASHIIPKQMIQWKNLVQQGKIEDARRDILKYSKLIDLLFCEANPIPVKMACHKMGLISTPELRLPLVTLSDKWSEALVTEMRNTGVLS